MTASSPALDAEVVRAHQRRLWALCYRITGSPADADELVQDTFVRALEHRPAHRDASLSVAEDLQPWLLRVAANLSRDRLRKRIREVDAGQYDGPWLPVPVASAEVAVAWVPGADVRYGELESASWAFLVALEVLTPLQRAVLVMRDALGYDTAETADALEITVANTKTTLHRARRAMAAYDARRVPPDPALYDRHRATMMRLLTALSTGRLRDVEALLADDVRTMQDAGGAYHAARNVLEGRYTVAALFWGLMRKSPLPTGIEERILGGWPAWIVTVPEVAGRRFAPRMIMQLELGPDGQIRELFALAAPDKVGRLLGE